MRKCRGKLLPIQWRSMNTMPTLRLDGRGGVFLEKGRLLRMRRMNTGRIGCGLWVSRACGNLLTASLPEGDAGAAAKRKAPEETGSSAAGRNQRQCDLVVSLEECIRSKSHGEMGRHPYGNLVERRMRRELCQMPTQIADVDEQAAEAQKEKESNKNI